MAYPYLPSGGIFQQAVDQFRKSLPATVDAATLKKLGIAPSNEGYIIATLKFLGILDESNNRTPVGVDLFTTHSPEEFAEKFASLVRGKYDPLFELRGEEAWKLSRDALISFFRTSDKTSEIVGRRQAIAFTTLASIASQRDEDVKSRVTRPRAAKAASEKPAPSPATPSNPSRPASSRSDEPQVGLTVRIEINLPPNGSQTTYDNIFQSIRKNLFP